MHHWPTAGRMVPKTETARRTIRPKNCSPPSHTRTGRFRSAHGQTISQPFIVALMTQLAEVAPDHAVLEVGTGSGYQAAILAHLARKVCTKTLACFSAGLISARGFESGGGF